MGTLKSGPIGGPRRQRESGINAGARTRHSYVAVMTPPWGTPPRCSVFCVSCASMRCHAIGTAARTRDTSAYVEHGTAAAAAAPQPRPTRVSGARVLFRHRSVVPGHYARVIRTALGLLKASVLAEGGGARPTRAVCPEHPEQPRPTRAGTPLAYSACLMTPSFR